MKRNANWFILALFEAKLEHRAAFHSCNGRHASPSSLIFNFFLNANMKLPLLHHRQRLSSWMNLESLPVVRCLVCLFFLKRSPLVPHYGLTAQIASVSRLILRRETRQWSSCPTRLKQLPAVQSVTRKTHFAVNGILHVCRFSLVFYNELVFFAADLQSTGRTSVNVLLLTLNGLQEFAIF